MSNKEHQEKLLKLTRLADDIATDFTHSIRRHEPDLVCSTRAIDGCDLRNSRIVLAKVLSRLSIEIKANYRVEIKKTGKRLPNLYSIHLQSEFND